MEPEAFKHLKDGASYIEAAAISVAISMKRIADEVKGDSKHLSLMNGIMHAIEQAIIHAKQMSG